MRGSVPLSALAAILMASCAGPSGLLGVRWGEESAAAARKLRIQCPTWTEWQSQTGFEECEDLQHPVEAFGRRPIVRLYRAGNRIEGISLEFLGCSDSARLEETLIETYDQERSSHPLYVAYWDDGVVHFERALTAQDSCVLTVAGPRFGKQFQAYQLKLGFANLSAGLRTR